MLSPQLALLIAVCAPVTSGLATLLLPRRAIATRTLLSALGTALSFALVLGVVLGPNGAPVAADDVVRQTEGIPWVPTVNLNLAFLADGIGAFFALLVSGIGVMIVLYARGYFGKDADSLYRFYPTLGFFTTAMLGIVLSDYTIQTLLFWEMTSISSFLLIGWDRYDKHAVKLAMQAFFTTGLGGMGLFGGILWFGFETDIWRWSQLYQIGVADLAGVLNKPGLMGAFLLMFFGAATKSAQFPWHYWLPGAMAAPTPVSAFLHSATMVKAGVFFMGRLFPVFGGAVIGHDAVTGAKLMPWLLIPFGAVTMLWGALVAIRKHDLKQIFAYTTVSQLGLLMTMYGLGCLPYSHDGHTTLAIDFDITQIANHAFYKAPLFIIAGALGHVASRQLPELFGAFKQHKAMCITLLLAGYALAAGPGTISFQAKELFLYAVYHAKDALGVWVWVLLAMTVVTAICNVGIFIRLATTVLGLPGGMQAPPEVAHADHHGHGHGHDEHAHEHGFWASMIWVPGLLIVSLQYVGGIATPLWNAVFLPLETNVFYEGFHGAVPALWQLKFGVPLMASAAAIVGGVLLGFSPLLRSVFIDPCDKIYPLLYRLCVDGGRRAFMTVQTGSLRFYVSVVILALTIGFASSVYLDPRMFAALRLAVEEFWQVRFFYPGLIIGALVCVIVLCLPLSQSRVMRVLLLGSAGFSVVVMFLVYQAPDLALTQVLFEIISVILFVMVLRLLPRRDADDRGNRIWRGLVGAAAGLAMGWMTIVAAPMPVDAERYPELVTDRAPTLGEFFAQHSYAGSALTDSRGGGGSNIVNVVLVDFRGFDTFGEITVLALAALGVWALIPSLRRNRYLPLARRYGS